jgi:hypothetical protein
MSEERAVPINDFRNLQPGDKVTRMLAGVIPMEMTVEKVEDGLIYMVGGWTFDQLTGVEEDEELGFGVKFNYTGSFLVKP